MKFAANLPLNSLSFGQTSCLFLRTYFDNYEEFSKIADLSAIFPIGERDLSSYEGGFAGFINQKADELLMRGMENHSRKDPAFKLWHLNGSIESYSDKTLLLSFYELNHPTKTELNIARQNRTAFTNKYTCEVFKSHGVDTVHIPLGFDSYNFHRTNKGYINDGRIVFNLLGKFEKRKHHAKVVSSWYKRFSGNPKYFLQCAIFNPHLHPNPEQQYNAICSQLQGGKRIFNSEYFGHMLQNSVYNDFLNSSHIIIGMSGAEGWGLPEFQSVALGKHAVILDAHGYRDWANDKNAVLVKPSGMIPAVDGYFFHAGGPFNQGEIYDFNEDEFIFACEQAIKRYEANPINSEGLKLQEEFSKERFTKSILYALND
jgi:hypothetical protein